MLWRLHIRGLVVLLLLAGCNEVVLSGELVEIMGDGGTSGTSSAASESTGHAVSDVPDPCEDSACPSAPVHGPSTGHTPESGQLEAIEVCDVAISASGRHAVAWRGENGPGGTASGVTFYSPSGAASTSRDVSDYGRIYASIAYNEQGDLLARGYSWSDTEQSEWVRVVGSDEALWQQEVPRQEDPAAARCDGAAPWATRRMALAPDDSFASYDPIAGVLRRHRADGALLWSQELEYAAMGLAFNAGAELAYVAPVSGQKYILRRLDSQGTSMWKAVLSGDTPQQLWVSEDDHVMLSRVNSIVSVDKNGEATQIWEGWDPGLVVVAPIEGASSFFYTTVSGDQVGEASADLSTVAPTPYLLGETVAAPVYRSRGEMLFVGDRSAGDDGSFALHRFSRGL